MEQIVGAAVEASHDDRTDAHLGRAVGDRVAGVELGETTLDERRGAGDGGVVDAEQDNREHVRSDSSDVGIGWQRGADRGAHATQHLVGAFGAESIVEPLEVDDVGDEHGDRLVGRDGMRGHVLAERRDEAVAGQQTGERVDRLVEDVAPALGGVVDRLAEQGRTLVGVDRCDVGAPPADLAVGSHDSVVHGDGGAAGRSRHELLDSQQLLRVDDVVDRHPGDVFGRQAEEPADRRVGTLDDSVEPDDQQPDRRRVERRLEQVDAALELDP